MITAKKVAKWIWTEFKKEMTIQKPDPATVARMRKEEISLGRKMINGGNMGVRVFFTIVIMLVIYSFIS